MFLRTATCLQLFLTEIIGGGLPSSLHQSLLHLIERMALEPTFSVNLDAMLIMMAHQGRLDTPIR